MNRVAGNKKWIILVCLITLVSWYLYNSLFVILYYNTKIDVAGFKLLQTEEEVTHNKNITDMMELNIRGKHYASQSMRLYFDNYGVFNGRLYFIQTSNPESSIIGIRVGDDREKAANKLKMIGFREDGSSFFKGCLRIDLFCSGDQISEIHIRAQNWFNLSFGVLRD